MKDLINICFRSRFLSFLQNSLEQSGEVNKSAIREVLATHRSLASIATLNNDIMDLCLETFKEYLDIMALVANKGDPNFVEVIELNNRVVKITE